jgi:leucyl aminopeptidase
VDAARIERITGGVTLGRDLINRPANDMDPEALEEAVMGLARRYGTKAAVIRGDRLIQANLPLIHAVGRASAAPPRLAEFSFGEVTVVGKGVCFDSGGLDMPSRAVPCTRATFIKAGRA